MRKLLILAAIVLLPTLATCQVDEIAGQLRAGKKVVLHKDSTYDFSAYEMIPVTDSIIGNGARIIHTRYFMGAAASNLTALFDVLDSAYIESVRFEGPTAYRGTTVYDKAHCMLKITGNATVIGCDFKNCYKWAINAYGSKWHPTINIRGCNFEKIQQQGYGYAIWTKNCRVNIDLCNFNDNRHAVDGSSKGGEVYIDSCNFYNHFVPINQHEEWGGIYGFKVMSIRNSNFLGINQAIQLKLPYSPDSGYVEVINCNFAADSLKVGTIANQLVWTMEHPQFKFKGNTHSSRGLPAAPVIKASADSVPVGGRVNYTSESGSILWGKGPYGKKANRVMDRPDVFVMRTYQAGKPYAFHTSFSYEQGKVFSFWLQIAGFGTAYVYRGDVLIYVIPYSKAEIWRQFVFRGEGEYKIVLKGSAGYQTLFHVDDVLNGYRETFETRSGWKTRFKYNLNGGPSIGLGLTYTEFRSGQSSLQVTIPADHPGTLEIR